MTAWAPVAPDDRESTGQCSDVAESTISMHEEMPSNGATRGRPSEPKMVSVKTALVGVIVSSVMAVVVTLAIVRDRIPVNPKADLEKPGELLNFVEEMAPLPGESLFKELSVAEVRAVARFAAEKLGCSTRYESVSKCSLSGTEAVALKQPAKAAALAHLDGDAAPPPRIAQVTVAHGDKSPEEGVGLYEVGPLDGNGGLQPDASVKLVQSFHWNQRPMDMSDGSVNVPVDKTVKLLKDLLLDTFGPIWYQFPDTYKPETKGSISWLSGANVFSSAKQRSSRIWFNWYLHPDEFQVNWLHTLPFAFDVLHEGKPEEWPIQNVSYCGQMFATPDLLLKAFKDNTVKVCKDVERTAYTWDVPGPDPGTKPSPESAVPKVVKTWQVTPGGSVRWRDWELIATLRPGSGLALHDVRFRSERILYELSLAEAQAFYSAPNSDKQFHYSDKAYSLLQLSADMVEGLDCPVGASFVDAAVWITTWRNASFTYDPALAKGMKLACIFESNGFEGSGWRHTQLVNRHPSGRAFHQLVIRAVGTVGNYDYITEIRLSEDGHIHVGEDFAGYPEVDRLFRQPTDARSLALDGSPDWGSTVQLGNPTMAGDNVQLLHAHFALFKVDLDVLGTENEFHVTTSETSSDGREDNAYPYSVKKIQKTRRVDKEDSETTFIANPTKPGVWRILNPKKLNAKTGTPRGYAVQIGSAPGVQTLPKGHPFSLAGSFARRHLAVTKRKDEEPTGVHNLDFYNLPEPIYSIDKFLSDGESLVGEDLVCWVSVGKDHVARAEDQPLVSNFGVYFTIAPWDYHEENAAMQLSMIGKSPEAEVVDLGAR